MLHRRDIARLMTVATLAAAPTAAWSADKQVRIESGTVVRWFHQQPAGEDEKTGLPAYEYFRADAGRLDADGLSAHFYGWGRYDLGDYYDDSAAGEILQAYAQYSLAATNLSVRLGRQYSFDGVSNASFDGARLATDLTPYFSLTAYGGLPVSVEEVDGRSGDRIWGGRLAHRFRGLYEVGVSLKRVDDDGDKQVESLGVDSSLTPPGPLSVYGYSRRNLVDDEWAEHSYEARLVAGSLVFKPTYQHFRYDAYFDTGRETAAPFANPTGGLLPFKDSGETVTVGGAELWWTHASRLELGSKARRYAYQEADDTAWYYSGFATARGKGLSQLGIEAGVMDGDASSDRYKLGRVSLYWDRAPTFVSCDVVYVRYDEEINGEESSLFASVGAGLQVVPKTLAVKLSGDFSQDPYFDKDYRGTLLVDYVFDR